MTPLQRAELAVLAARLDRKCDVDQFVALVEKLIEAAKEDYFHGTVPKHEPGW